MGKASKRKHLNDQRKQFFAIHGDGRSAEDRANARSMLDALQKKLEDDALREDGFYFLNGKYKDSRRPRLTSGMKTRAFETHRSSITDIAIVRMTATSQENDLVILFTFGLDCVSVWNFNNGKLLSSLDVSLFHTQSIFGGAAHLQCAGFNAIVFAYATYNEPIAHCFNYQTNAVTPATAPLKTFDVANNYCTNHQQAISSMKFSHQGKLLATSSWDSTCMLWKVSPVIKEDQKSTAHKSDAYQAVHLTLLMILPVHEEGASCLAFSVDDQALVTCGECVVKVWDISDASADNQVDVDKPGKTLSLDAQLQEWQQAIPFSFSIESSTNLFAFDESMTTLVANHEWFYVGNNSEILTLLAPAQSEQERTEVIDIKQCLEHIIEEIDPNDDEFEKLLKSRQKSNHEDATSKNNITSRVLDNGKVTNALTMEESARLKTQFRNMKNFDFERLFTPALSLRWSRRAESTPFLQNL